MQTWLQAFPGETARLGRRRWDREFAAILVIAFGVLGGHAVFATEVGSLGVDALHSAAPVDQSKFASVMASGSFDDLDSSDDLIVCSPHWGDQSFPLSGRCAIAYGASGQGLQWPAMEIYRREQAAARTGSALAVGDFDDDGIDDIAVGVPGYDALGSATDAGAVVTMKWDSGAGVQVSAAPRVIPDHSAGDEAGAALAACDFNGDGFDDLAIGVPGFTPVIDIPPVPLPVSDGGAVVVVYGSLTGLPNFSVGQVIDRVLFADAQVGERFGSVLASGDFDGDDFCDLAIGSPERDVDGQEAVGQVMLLFGGATGLVTPPDPEVFRPMDSGLIEVAGTNYGAAVVLAELRTSGCSMAVPCTDELVIGVPGAIDTVPASERGAVVVVRQDDPVRGLQQHHVFFQDDLINQTVQDGGRFGETLLAAPLEPPGYGIGSGAEADLVIGMPSFAPTPGTMLGGAFLLSNGPTASGVDPSSARLLEITDGPLASRSDQMFGAALTAGDFDGNGVLDLVVGAPGWWSVDPSRGTVVVEGAALLYRSGPLFSDGFESGSTAEWSSSTP